jgi:hypothetical protein
MNDKETRIVSATGGEKGSKPAQFDQIPTVAMIELAKTYGFGASKYSAHNFRKGYDYSLSFSAMQRHAWAWQGGQDLDEESGLNHLAHVAWHCFNLIAMQDSPEQADMFDDRFDA